VERVVSTPPANVLGRDGALPEGEEKRQAVEAMFDRVAPGYDRMNRVISLGMDRRWRRCAIAGLALAPGERVLDLACGTGDLCRDLTASALVPIGIDVSEGMLRAATTDAPLVRGDGAALPVPDGALDGLVCGFAMRNFVDLTAVLEECARVLRPAGRIAMLDAAVPGNPVMRAGNAVWFRGAVPMLGRLFARDAEAYRYLPRSTAYLPDAAALVAAFEAAGFESVERTTMTGGSVQLVTGTRRAGRRR
jgi:demethylmenaquinone methyltransferase/2-methoxy-6-polyprenyl-1,4-benzoquinol methylase